jgi:hypothetical protein
MIDDEDCDCEVQTYEVNVIAEGQCCERMVSFLRADNLPIYYSAKFREWGINYPGGDSIQLIEFCPWCGTKLPDPLGDQWHERIRVMGLDPDEDEIPEPMRTDRWWRDEGL